MLETTLIPVDAVKIGKRRRPINSAEVERLTKSIDELGLIVPIKVCIDDEKTPWLVSGHHRLEAHKRLKRKEIKCTHVVGDKIERELMEIFDNLHRARLTVLERSEQVSRFACLTRIKMAQAGPVSEAGGRGKRGGSRTVASELGFTRNQVDRSVKIAMLSPDAKEAALSEGVDDNQSILLVAASKAAQYQACEIRHLAEAKRKAHKRRSNRGMVMYSDEEF